MPLIDYINKHYNGSKASFARAVVVSPAQVTQWLKKDFIVVNGKLYSYRRDVD